MTALLEVTGLAAGYRGSTVLPGVDLVIERGRSLALLGRNGVGKTTLVNSVMGVVRPTAGSVRVDGVEIARRPANVAAKAGLAIVPQGRRIFAPLTVEENLRIAWRKGGSWTMERVYELMPRLAERRGNRGSELSGGEQQMLSIGRALLRDPKLLLLDEPSDGLAPAVIAQIAELITTLQSEADLTVLLVEQDLRLAFAASNDVAVMQKGQIVHRATTATFRTDPATAHRLLGVG